jgi:phage terminase large subunit
MVVLMATITVPSKVLNESYLFLLTEPARSTPLQIFYGSASSGKSVFIAQRDIFDCINEPRNFLIVRNTGNTLRTSVFEERCKIIRNFGMSPLFDIRESDLTITYMPRGNRMLFRGLDDVERLKSITVPIGTLTDLRVEEATEVSEAAYDELGRRMRGLSDVPKREVLSFNPVFRTHWICKRWFNGQQIKYYRDKDVLIFHTTFRNNKFLTDQDRKKLLSYKGYQKDVYADGKWGVLGDLIFTDWEVADLKGMEFDNVYYGLDFGFTNDPSAAIKVALKSNEKILFITSEVYEHGATNDVLAAKIKPMVKESTVWCDSAEPKSITEMRNQGINRIEAMPVSKGRDSVWHSIQWLQQWKIVIDKSCTNTINEISQYQWQKNKDGISLNEPIGINDHCIAALRYATERVRLGATVSVSI